MVFLTPVRLMALARGPDKFWRINQYLRFSWHFRGRKRNCFSVGVKFVNKGLMKSYLSTKLRKIQMRHLWNTRLEAASQEHSLSRDDFLEGLARSDVQLDRKVLSELAVYEPRTFQSLTEISKQKMASDCVDTYKHKPWGYKN